MANVVVVGSQWGDEGKGKIVDWLSEQADIVVRFQGGHNAGHTLVIPKAPARNIIDIKVEDYLHVARATHKIAAAAKKAFDADGVTIQQFNETAGGQVVFHLHQHVMPRHDGVALLPPASRKEDGEVLKANAAKLVAALKG